MGRTERIRMDPSCRERFSALDYRLRAVSCLAMADRATGRHRDQLMAIARVWEAFALPAREQAGPGQAGRAATDMRTAPAATLGRS